MFFDPPIVLTTKIFARLPDKFRRQGRNTEWLQNQPGLSWTHSFLEGPSFDKAGNLYCVDIAWGRIFKVSPEGIFDLVVEYDGEPNGLKIHQDGRIFIADFKNGIMVLNPESGRIETVLNRVRLERFKAVNDLFFASNGDLYFTDQGVTGYQDPSGRVFRIRVDGHVDCLMDKIPSPNGLVLNLAEDTLYLAVTRANAVWRVPLMRDGTVAKVGTFIQLSGGNGPDGLAIDEAGNLVVAHMGLGSAWVFDPRGEPLFRIKSCGGHATTNVAYGGPERKTLFITESESGSILMAELPTAGRAMYSGA